MTCWVVEQGLAVAGSCDGALIKAHLIPKQRIKRELVDVARDSVRRRRREQGWRKPAADLVSKTALREELERLVWDSRVWVAICGGPMGNGGHHGQLDYAGVNRIKVARAQLPPELEEYAKQYGLEWSLEADYGPRETVQHG